MAAMTRWRTLLASLLILVGGTVALALATDNFRAFTTATAWQAEVARSPRPVPDALLQIATGEFVHLDELRGRWLLVDFIYTRCTTYCAVQGRGFARLQEELAGPLKAGEAALLSLSFDPARDAPAELAAYRRRLGGHAGMGWFAARPTDRDGLERLLKGFGVTAVDDGFGGFVHDATISVVDPGGRLVAVLDPLDFEAAGDFLLEQLAP